MQQSVRNSGDGDDFEEYIDDCHHDNDDSVKNNTLVWTETTEMFSNC